MFFRYGKQSFLISVVTSHHARPGLYSAFRERKAKVWDNKGRINFHGNTKTRAARTGSIWAIKAKTADIERIKFAIASWAQTIGGKNFGFVFSNELN